jgi:NTP pyrophosphatase (non-canonical NTP hydrolase)
MKYEEYKEKVSEFNKYPEERMLACLVTGIVSEILEYIEATKNYQTNFSAENVNNVLAEAGDITWYISQLDNLLELGLTHDEYSEAMTQEAVLRLAKSMCDYVHKGYRDNSKREFPDLSVLLDTIASEKIMKNNFYKLQSRYDRGVIGGDGDAR